MNRAKQTRTTAVARLVKSAEFINWPNIAYFADFDEPHFTPETLATLWGVSVYTIRRIFEKESGVLKYGSTHSRGKRRYVTMRIPHAVAMRVHKKLTA